MTKKKPLFPVKDFRLKGSKITEKQRVSAVRKAMSKEIKDCRVIKGDQGVIISKDTAIAALLAMTAFYTKERLEKLFTDDRSFISANFHELQNAVDGTD